MSFPLWIGCEGCRSPETEPSDGQAEPASDYTFGGAQPMPQGLTLAQAGVKPGHWFAVTETIRSNRVDQRGTLRHAIELVPAAGADGDGDPPQAQRLPLQSERPAVLPRGRSRRFDARLLASSPQSLRRGARAFLSGQYSSRTQGGTLETGRQSVNLLQQQEYFFIVLTRRPQRFAWTHFADWVRPLVDEIQFPLDVPINYRLIFPQTDGLLALPETMLDWTSTAVLLWDDLEPAALTPQQQLAILDWVHFGGRMIVNAPAAGVELSRSRFAELMPQEVQGNGELNPEEVEGLLRHWSVSGDATVDRQNALVRQHSGRLVSVGPVHPAATAIEGTSDLVLTRRAGRGQVVLSRFDLTSDWMREWRSRDSFVNAALLGRPGRVYTQDGETVMQMHRLADSTPQAEVTEAAATSEPQGWQVSLAVDAAVNTDFRLLSRDARLLGTTPGQFVSHPTQGLGGWRDDSDLSVLAVQTLRNESGVAIPPRRFVLHSLGIYLLILVPLNYLVFRLLGRLEWAWLVVPVIGLAGAAWIARGASLDVGFARSRTEIAVVELQRGYPRGHVTRFMSLYNSLSRQYDLAFDSPDAAAAPLGILGQVPEADDQRQTLTLRHGYDDGPALAGVPVASNRTRIFHTEQVTDFGGSIELQDDWLRNGTSIDLMDAWLIRKTDQGQVQVAALGHCDAGSRIRVRWRDETAVRLPESLPLQTQELLRPLAQADRLAPGAARLVAHCPQVMPGLEVRPEPAQQSFAAIVLVHLQHPRRGVGTGDQNLPPERLEKQRQMLEEEEFVD